VYLAPAGRGAADPVPGKLFDAVGAERPLLAVSPRGPVRDLVQRLGLGIVAHPDDRAGLVAQLAELHRRVLDDEILPGPDPAAYTELSSRTAVARVIETLERVCARERVPCGSPSAS
jgi:hypothetical protein